MRKVIYMTYYARKATRIPHYDYSSSNYYFVTICTHNRKCLFGTPDHLNRLGHIVTEQILQISSHYQNVRVDKYVVMPNHVHMILVLQEMKQGPSVSQIIGQLKSGVTRDIHRILPELKVWQRSFHDHIIRNQAGYEKIWLYIEGNPINWSKDCFYVEPFVGSTL